MTGEAIERGAKVLFEWQYGHDRWDEAEPETRQDCCEASAAFLEAMRQPTDDMMVAGAAAIVPHAPDRMRAGAAARDAFRAMIDEALKPT